MSSWMSVARSLSVALTVAGFAAAGSQAFAVSAPAVDGAGPASASSFVDQYAVGDRLRVVLFEQVGGGGALANLLERTEVTGEYVVQADGSIYFPLLGAVRFAERTGAQVEESVSQRLEAAMKGRIKLVIQVLEREPVYIVGRGVRSTTLKHSPGMTVMHALALSGNSDAAGGDLWRRLDLSREEERLTKTDERLVRLLAKRDVLAAERSGATPRASSSLKTIAGLVRADAILGEEARVRGLEVDESARRSQALDNLEDAVAHEIEVQRGRVSHLDRVMKDRAERLATVRDHRRRGVATEASLQAAVIEADASRERWHESNVVLAQTERRLLEVRQEKAKLLAESLMEREVRLRELSAAINEEGVARDKLRPVVMTADAEAAPRGAAPEHFIHRRTATGLKRLAADAATPILPGDLVEIRLPGGRNIVDTMALTGLSPVAQ